MTSTTKTVKDWEAHFFKLIGEMSSQKTSQAKRAYWKQLAWVAMNVAILGAWEEQDHPIKEIRRETAQDLLASSARILGGLRGL